jgi:hypothetical protein
MSDAPQRFPLAWPPHKARKPAHARKFGQFSAGVDNGSYVGRRKITAAEATQRVERELDRLGGRWPILSSNLELRVDGRPRADKGEPVDPGACLYFDLKGIPHAMACDTYMTVAQNIAAIAAHLEASRAIERYGVATAAEALQAFAALPPPPDIKPKRPWWQVLGVDRSAVDADDVKALFRVKANKAHPDKGGTAEAMAELNNAMAEAMAKLKGVTA